MTDHRWWLITLMLAGSVMAQGVAEEDFLQQVQKLAPPYTGDAAPGDELGKSIALSGHLMLVGMPGDDNPLQLGFNAGAALVFRRDVIDPGEWVLEAKLIGDELSQEFGASVALDGEIAAVGDPSGDGSGVVYLFSANRGGAGAWGLITTVVADDPQSGAQFGAGLDLKGESLIVGAPNFSDVTSNIGAAYIFSRNTGGPDGWGQTARLIPDPTRVENSSGPYSFGTSVAISTGPGFGLAAVGAPGDALLSVTDTGTVYTYVLDSGANTWSLDQQLFPATPQAGDRTGSALTLLENTMAAGGARGTSVNIFSRQTGSWLSVQELLATPASFLGSALSLEGDRLAAADSNDQTVTLFERDRGGLNNWGAVSTLSSTELPSAGLQFSSAVALSQGTLVMGSPRDSTFGQLSGAVAVFEQDELDADIYNEQTPVSAGPSGAGEGFGNSVAVDGSFAIIGAPLGNEQAASGGLAFIFQRSAGTWQPAATLQPSQVVVNHNFGFMVDISGSVAAVVRNGGFPRQVYLFEKDQGGTGNWGERAVLVPESGSDSFAISIDGDTLVIGSYAATNTASDITGIAEIFQRDQGGADQWGRVTTVAPTDVSGRVFFGWAVDLHADRLVVGAINDNEAGMEVGAAYIFERHLGGQNNWGEVTRLVPSDSQTRQNFGSSVAVSGNTIAISAPNFLDSAGAVYLFEETMPGSWSEQTQLSPSLPGGFKFFGNMVQLSGDTLIVSDENYADPMSPQEVTGSVEVFQRNSGGLNNWGVAKRLLASDGRRDDGLSGVLNSGYTNRGSIGFDGTTVMAGAYGVDTDNEDVGAVYVYFTDVLLRDGFEDPPAQP